MSRIRRPRGRSSLGVALASVALLAAACSSGSSSSGTTTTTVKIPSQAIPAQTKVDAVAQLVPSAIASTGKVTFAMDATYPPDEFLAPGSSTIVGMDADLATAMAQVMGLTPVMQNVTFDAIIPGLTANKYNVGLSSFTITADREKSVDFVEYFQAGEAFYVKSGNAPTYTSLTSLCGHSVAVESGTIEETDAKSASTTCTSSGSKPVSVLSYSTQDSVNLAVASGRADVGFADSPVVAWVVAQSGGALALSGQPFSTAPYGVATNKGNGMAQAIAAALNQLQSNGTYATILKKWGLDAGAVSTISVNPTVS